MDMSGERTSPGGGVTTWEDGCGLGSPCSPPDMMWPVPDGTKPCGMLWPGDADAEPRLAAGCAPI